MSLRALVLAAPSGRIVPDRPEFEVFFRVVHSLGAVIEQAQRIDAEALAGRAALLLGDPTEELPGDSATAVSAWIERGGSLLLANSDASRRFTGLLPAPLQRGLTLRLRRPPRGQLPLRPLCLGAVPAPAATTLLVPATLRDVVTGLRPWEPWEPARGWSRGWLAKLLRRDGEHSLAQLTLGAGRLLYLSAPQLLGHEGAPGILGSPEDLLIWIAARWLCFAEAELPRRMARAQRHRLLHGYPMAPLMSEDVAAEELEALTPIIASRRRRTIVGVLPHPFCNPQVKGCGFCTFPHEDYSGPRAHELAATVCAEIEQATLGRPHRRVPAVAGLEGALASAAPRRKVEAVYLGGGTANLTPPEDLRALCAALSAHFDLRGAEVTLEGVPIYFIARRPRPLNVLREALPGCSLRISMGVQTFDGEWLARMGRRAFGDAGTFAEVVAAARALDMGVSLDLLCNLPGQPLWAMREDVERALALGVDQLCLYHLVLDEGMDTAWASDRSLLARRPDNGAACQSWLALREQLLGVGFVQRTLTNFERAGAEAEGRGFRYERLGFSPEEVDVLGFGPGGLSLRLSDGMGLGLKTMNAASADGYLSRAKGGSPIERSMVLGRRDLQVLWLTRQVALLGIDRAAYERHFFSDVLTDFGEELSACERRGLCHTTAARVDLTPEGMFYADTVAGLLAARQVEALKLRRFLKGRPAHAARWRHSFDDIADQELELVLTEDPNDPRDHGMG